MKLVIMSAGVQILREGLVSAHVDSFNYVVDEGINLMAQVSESSLRSIH